MITNEERECALEPVLADALKNGMRVRFRAEGRSMEPFILAGDMAVVVPVAAAGRFRRGDVILYTLRSGVLRLHRFRRIAEGDGAVLIVRGDAAGQAFERVSPDQVLGVLESYERRGRVYNARHPLRRFAGLAWPRLRKLMQIGKTKSDGTANPADAPALTIVKEALKATLRGDAGEATATTTIVEPHALVAMARRHGVLAICARELVRRSPAAGPAMRDTLRALAVEGELGRAQVAAALNAIRTADIAPLVVKGPALAALAYGDPAIRPYDDVDLLLDNPARVRALDVLRRIGWRDSRNTPPAAQRHLLRTTEDIALVHPQCGIGIELVHPGGILRDAAPAAESPLCHFEIHGTSVAAPAKIEHFLYCAAHGAKHGYTRLVWLADLDRLAADFTDADWTSLAELARARRLTRVLGLSAALARKVLATPFPSQITAICSDADWIAATTTRCLDAQARGDRHVETWRWWLGLQDTSGQRVAHCIRWLFTPTGADLRACVLPLWAHHAYIVLRPMRLLARLVLRRPAPKLTW